MGEPELPHNAVKLPLTIAATVLFLLLIALAAWMGDWSAVAFGVAIEVALLAGLRAMRQGRNPWYTRAPADRRAARRGR
jgi:hypothetical protein